MHAGRTSSGKRGAQEAGEADPDSSGSGLPVRGAALVAPCDGKRSGRRLSPARAIRRAQHLSDSSTELRGDADWDIGYEVELFSFWAREFPQSSNEAGTEPQRVGPL
jgi:hypothetical protein